MPERLTLHPNENHDRVSPCQEMTEAVLAYNPGFDIQDYRQLLAQKASLSPEEFTRRKNQFEKRTTRQQETNLAERFNLEYYSISYRLEDDKLISPDYDEPFADVIGRGIDYRSRFANPNDRRREQAELLGFQRAQELLPTVNSSSLSGSTEPFGTELMAEVLTAEVLRTEGCQLSTKVIVISPRGGNDSIYQHNFFYVYEKLEECEVKMTRYPSRLNLPQFYQIARKFDPKLPLPIELTDAFFLSHPIVTNKETAEILESLHAKENTMNQQEFQRLCASCAPLIASYINTLSSAQNSPELEKEIYETHNAIINYSDKVANVTQTGRQTGRDPVGPVDFAPCLPHQGETLLKTLLNLEGVISYYGQLPVRQVTTGCGIQGGFPGTTNYELRTMNYSPLSVAEFGISNCRECGSSGDHFHCPREKGGCGAQIPSGRSITKCPSCGLTKEEAGSSCS